MRLTVIRIVVLTLVLVLCAASALAEQISVNIRRTHSISIRRLFTAKVL